MMSPRFARAGDVRVDSMKQDGGQQDGNVGRDVENHEMTVGFGGIGEYGDYIFEGREGEDRQYQPGEGPVAGGPEDQPDGAGDCGEQKHKDMPRRMLEQEGAETGPVAEMGSAGVRLKTVIGGQITEWDRQDGRRLL